MRGATVQCFDLGGLWPRISGPPHLGPPKNMSICNGEHDLRKTKKQWMESGFHLFSSFPDPKIWTVGYTKAHDFAISIPVFPLFKYMYILHTCPKRWDLFSGGASARYRRRQIFSRYYLPRAAGEFRRMLICQPSQFKDVSKYSWGFTNTESQRYMFYCAWPSCKCPAPQHRLRLPRTLSLQYSCCWINLTDSFTSPACSIQFIHGLCFNQ